MRELRQLVSRQVTYIERVASQPTSKYHPPENHTKHAHLVPKFMVKTFCTHMPIYALTPLNGTNKIAQCTKTDEICTRNHAYEFRNAKREIMYRNLIETYFLSPIEDHLSVFYRHLLSTLHTSTNITPFLQQYDNRYALFLLAIMVLLRTYDNLPKLVAACEDIGVPVPQQDCKNTSLMLFCQVLSDFTQRIMPHYHIAVYTAPVSQPFILSSRPAVMRRLCYRATGALMQTDYISLPLSPRYLLFLSTDIPLFGDGKIISVPPATVQYFNQLLLQDPETEQVVCADELKLREYQQYRNQYHNKTT